MLTFIAYVITVTAIVADFTAQRILGIINED